MYRKTGNLFWLIHQAEVKDVCITEYKEKSFVDGIRAEGRAEGQNEKGLAVYRNLRKRGFSKEDALCLSKNVFKTSCSIQ